GALPTPAPAARRATPSSASARSDDARGRRACRARIRLRGHRSVSGRRVSSFETLPERSEAAANPALHGAERLSGCLRDVRMRSALDKSQLDPAALVRGEKV